MGVLLAGQKGETAGAFEAFANAVSYAKPTSQNYCSSSLYWQGVICNLQERTDDALNFALSALEADGRNTGVAFLAVELYAKKKGVGKCLEFVEICEAADVNYFFKCRDSVLISAIPAVGEFFWRPSVASALLAEM